MRLVPELQGILRALATIALVGLAASCGDSGSGSGSGETTAPIVVAPAPQDLALECVLPAPDATWTKARTEIGGMAAFLPTTAGGLVAVSLHFPLTVSEAIDGRVPAVCAATLAKDSDVARGVLGVHLRWPDRLLDGLTKGADAKFNVRTDTTAQMQVLEARDPKDATAAIGVIGNYLLIAQRPEDLAAIGPYVARTMPSRAKDFPTAGVRIAGAKEEAPIDFVARVPAAALGGPIAASGKRAWADLATRLADRLPLPLSFASDADAALAVLPDLEGAELRVTIGEASTRIEATAPVRKGSPGEATTRAVAAGDASPLLALPRETLAGALFRRLPSTSAATPGTPAASNTASPSSAPTASNTASASSPPAASNTASAGPASPTSAAIAKALGVSEEKDAAKIEALAKAFDEARGPWTTAGFAFDGTGPSAYVRASVRDPGALDGALKDFLALADGARPTDPVRGAKLRMTTGKTILENIPGDVYRIRVARGGDTKKSTDPPAASTDTPTAVDILFRRSDDVFVAATGYASRDALRAVLTSPTGDSLQKIPEIEGPLTRLGTGVAVAAFFDPARIAASRAGKPGSTSVAPIVIGLGRDAGDTVTVFVRIDAPNTAIAALGRWVNP